MHSDPTGNSNEIVMYTTDWCADCWRAKQVMQSLKVSYQEIDITTDDDAFERVLQLNNGKRSVPTIVFPDGSVLTEPSAPVLMQKLQRLGWLA
ncbi:MAG: NrdH-redoxin [Chloroflexi bacterium]|nr:MAG: NrdH-redoxin [Chloroflexota bacterium]